MSKATDCLRHQDTWMERNIAESFLMIIAGASILSYFAFGNIFLGFGVGIFVAVWMLFRCIAKEMYFTTVGRIKDTRHD